VSAYSDRVSAANLHSPSYYLRPSDEAGIKLVAGWASALLPMGRLCWN